ncbi:porphobilinogen synthase [Portibacter lacus]|uniref:Delta-aminolevulinic acid dehydratase n=1 Tax=Portibacter lacus TaxID=1099794 RepID=A0AA37SU89_9BACT|nr:porphobilinogen synthase [Portibacter lacus]GLR18318.1 delta-aminolevulinic acid dehydratase [Portibacter lacus]
MIRRPRRLRTSSSIRKYTQEHTVQAHDLIFPLFVVSGENRKIEISSMPGIHKMSIDNILLEIEECVSLGIEAFILFGTPDTKDALASSAYADGNIIEIASKAIKAKFPEVWLIADICVCSYTDHGHCGVLKNGKIDNDLSLDLLAKMAVSCAKAGIDTVAPSAMMDGQIEALRSALDKENLVETSVMSYSAKYFSSFYGPFREAADSAPQEGDRSTYQMDPANSKEAIVETELDVAQGADFIMVKPAMSYMDIISKLNDAFDIPLVAYNVSGEYSMIKAAAEKGWVDEKKIVSELLLSFKRAGANLIITYFAKDFLNSSKS